MPKLTEQTAASAPLPRAATPEEVGVSSGAILELLEEYDKQGLEYHGLMILRHGKVAYEIYRRPYAPEIPHAIYSFSKSVAGTAVGFAIDEGLFSLDTTLAELFPEYAAGKSERWKRITVRHMLTMTSGLAFDVFHKASSPDWVGDYLNSKLRDEPGATFHYTNENAYIFSVLIRRLTGQTLFEYLTPRLFVPLGIDVPYTETDRFGNPAGGWGIYWKLEDSARFIQCYLDGGKWQGTQVIPEWWAREATRKQVDNPENPKADSRAGYGYQFWMCAKPNTFAARGMFTQQGMAMRDQDAVFVYFGADADEQKPQDVIFPHFPDGFCEEGAAPDEAALAKIRELQQNLAFPSSPVLPRSPLEETLSRSVIRIRPNYFLNAIGFPWGFLPMTVNQMSVDHGGYINNFQLEFKDSELQFSWQESKDGKDKLSVPLGLDGEYRAGHISLCGFEFDTLGSAHWQDSRTLVLSIRPMQSCALRTFTLRFSGKRVHIVPHSTPTFRSIAKNLAVLSHAYLNNSGFFNVFADAIFAIAPSIMEPHLFGRIRTINNRPEKK
ncbi:MAG: beta-lactamase family protein [Oscillospiraceae bacterium]|jgi:CubicO group peptidase (beta-lactamase class C family)|nr:beta-lactamase family protein [Oscillospiraceae bacterium]